MQPCTCGASLLSSPMRVQTQQIKVRKTLNYLDDESMQNKCERCKDIVFGGIHKSKLPTADLKQILSPKVGFDQTSTQNSYMQSRSSKYRPTTLSSFRSNIDSHDLRRRTQPLKLGKANPLQQYHMYEGYASMQMGSGLVNSSKYRNRTAQNSF